METWKEGVKLGGAESTGQGVRRLLASQCVTLGKSRPPTSPPVNGAGMEAC